MPLHSTSDANAASGHGKRIKTKHLIGIQKKRAAA